MFLATGQESWDEDLAILAASGVTMMVVGAVALWSATHNHFARGALFAIIGFAGEAVFWTWFLSLDIIWGFEVFTLTLGFQCLPLVFAVLMALCLKLLQQSEEESKELEQRLASTESFIQTADANDIRRVVYVQAVARRRLARRRAIRTEEISNWFAQRVERTILIALCYVFVGAFVALAFWINLVFGVKFTPDQAQAWLVASFVAFGFDVSRTSLSSIGRFVVLILRDVPGLLLPFLQILFSQPFGIFLRTLFSFAMKVGCSALKYAACLLQCLTGLSTVCVREEPG